MVLSNALIFQGDKGFVRGSLKIVGNRIGAIHSDDDEDQYAEHECCDAVSEGAAGCCGKDIGNEPGCCGKDIGNEPGCCGKDIGNELGCCAEDGPDLRIDLKGNYIIPGLVDIHTHGNSNYDFSDGDEAGLKKIAEYMASHGITSFLPTSMTLPHDRLEKAFRTAAGYSKKRPENGARVLGIHMEGPFLSEKKKGAQNGAFLRLPDRGEFSELQECCGNMIRIVDVAPELEGAEAFVREVCSECCVSVAHTDASYEDARRVFEAGAHHVTHLFNAMPQIHHRSPGVIGAASETEDVMAELICDGLHVHPSAVRMAFKLFPGRICLISDSLRCCGMPDGDYELGGQQITLKDGQARTKEGNLAGAVSNLYEDMVNAMHYGIRAEDAVTAAALNPAKAAGVQDEIGSLEEGKLADLLVCDENWNLKQVYVNGVMIQSESS